MKTDEQILEGVKTARKKAVKQEAMRLGSMRVSDWVDMINKDMSFKEYQATVLILGKIIRNLPKINKVR